MNGTAHEKVNASHLKRNAYLYIRQSTLRQVLENTESTLRQYDLRQRAIALGWPVERITIIDSDLGQSAATAADREGFQKLVAEVSLEKAGIVLGLEVSRLARNSTDWHRLLEICALTDTLILDEDGLYDPRHFNDRLLLGLKGAMQVERARYEADLAQRRYLHVDPANRLVADSLEADWNNKLRALTAAQEQYEEQRQNDRAAISEQQRASIAALAHDFPRLWQNPKTPDRERKRLVRLLLDDVTLIQNEAITAHVRFKSGITKTLTVPLPLNAWQQRATSSEVVREVDRLLDHNTYLQIVSLLNHRGLRSGEGNAFTPRIVARIRRRYGLTSRYDRLRKAGMLTVDEMAAMLGLTTQCVKIWNRHGLLRGHAYSDKNDCLFEHPGDNPPRKTQGVKLSKRRLANEVVAQGTQEVQCEA